MPCQSDPKAGGACSVGIATKRATEGASSPGFRALLRHATLVSLCFLASSAARATQTPPTPPAPARQNPAAKSSLDWPAFHGGGPLLGAAAPLPGGGPALKLRWTYVAGGDNPSAIEGSAAIVRGTAYVADAGGTLHAIDLADGRARWTYKTENGFETTPLVMTDPQKGELVLIGDLAGVFHAVGAKDGKKLWTVETQGPIHASANAAGANVVFGNDSAAIYCLRASDGKEVWRRDAGDRINAAPAVGFGKAFVSGCDAQLRAINIEDGKEAFAVDMRALSGASPALLEDQQSIVIGTDQGRVLCYSADGQRVLWKFEQIENGAMVYASPAVADGLAVVGARDRKVYALDVKTGQPKWTFPTRGDVDSSPVVSGGRVYVGSKDKRFYVLDLKTGQKLWEFTARRAITASPAIAEGVVIVGDTAGNLYCFEPAQ